MPWYYSGFFRKWERMTEREARADMLKKAYYTEMIARRREMWDSVIDDVIKFAGG